ncbi:hypothetical protein NDU88_003511 [Pleurodeles waltl]|uniref:Uncharacterized protein n=1 Tax=Pleurodeles waltl TaxID=8319 RepID=A0AAV7VEE1_PLEWA|nr:hypothetical protein NDU88_003511 [Pleurodeles waltl]
MRPGPGDEKQLPRRKRGWRLMGADRTAPLRVRDPDGKSEGAIRMGASSSYRPNQVHLGDISFCFKDFGKMLQPNLRGDDSVYYRIIFLRK